MCVGCGMTWLFLGFSFLLLDCNFNTGNILISLTPDFVGYFFVLLGVQRMWARAPRSKALRVFAIVMIALSLADFIFHLLGLTQHLIPVHMVLLAPKVLMCYFILRLMQGTEQTLGITLSAMTMRHLLYGYAGCYAFMLIVMSCPNIADAAFVLQLFVIGTALMILFTFAGAAKRYHAFLREPQNTEIFGSEQKK